MMNNDIALSERANLTKQYAQRTVKAETRRAPACVAGTPYKRCRTIWFAPQTGRMHWGAFLYNWGAYPYSSLRLLPNYVRSLREQKNLLTTYHLSLITNH